VSHATADKWLAVTLCEKIDIAGGEIIPDKIFAEIARSRKFIVLLTPASVERPWVLIEVGAACMCDGLRIIPIMYHVGPDPIPAMIHRNKGFLLNDFGAYISEVSARVKGET
jgi:hypothetical protein